ncbi:MAG: hypothetical protein G01um101413_931 [Parcubacteria group bacterium Gr01-1014_13]|nr:MAG: hypothetical protein G01um101413_931 [Parcubacteria group bacterium Gr01-1014_13]
MTQLWRHVEPLRLVIPALTGHLWLEFRTCLDTLQEIRNASILLLKIEDITEPHLLENRRQLIVWVEWFWIRFLPVLYIKVDIEMPTLARPFVVVRTTRQRLAVVIPNSDCVRRDLRHLDASIVKPHEKLKQTTLKACLHDRSFLMATLSDAIFLVLQFLPP